MGSPSFHPSSGNTASLPGRGVTTGVPQVVLPLDGWNEGDPIYIRATATCGTQQPRVVLPKIVYHVKTSADVQATPVVTPAGGCEATSGAVSVSLTGVSGFSRVQYKLERDPVRAGQQAVPVGNLTARSPYQQTLFFNLAPGRYTLHVRATPNCTPTAPRELRGKTAPTSGNSPSTWNIFR